MSKMECGDEERLQRCEPGEAARSAQVYPASERELGTNGLKIRRALPLAKRRLIGPFCFLDHFGPITLAPKDAGMDVAAHPHIGLQTVTWLIEGGVLHRDSLGYEQLIRPGQLNVMTAGRGISHSEETPEAFAGPLHGVQLWVALPDADRHTAPAFEHHAQVPCTQLDRLHVSLVTGSALGLRSPSTTFSEQVSMAIRVTDAGEHVLALAPHFEHGVIVVEGTFHTDEHEVAPGTLSYMSQGHDELRFHTRGPAQLFLVGGPPFEESILMFWNFVGRTRDEIVEAANQWNASDPRFGEVSAYPRGRLSSPPVGPIRPS